MNGVKTIRYRVTKIERKFGQQDFWENAVRRRSRSDTYYQVTLEPISLSEGLLVAPTMWYFTEFPMEINQVVTLEGGF